MAQGTVKFFREDKGFGFIKSQGQPDIFVHISAVDKHSLPLQIGDRVEFEVEDSKRGLRAVQVRRV